MKNKPSILFLIALVMMNMLGLLASDIFVPALPELSQSLQVAPATGQLALTAFLLSFGGSMLVYGPLAERFGRKRVLLVAQSLFAASTAVALVSSSIDSLLVARVLQGVGAASGVVLSSPILIKEVGGERASRLLNAILPLNAISPAIAPAVGGFLAEAWGWRSTFGVMLLIAALLLVLVFITVRKDGVIGDEGQKQSMLRHYAELLSNKRFFAYLVIAAAGTSIWFAYLSIAPFILGAAHYSSAQIGLVFMWLASVYVGSNYFIRFVFPKVSVLTYLVVGFVVLVTGGVLLLGFQWLALSKVWQTLIPMSLVIAGNGLVMPAAMSLAITHEPHRSVYATALLSSLRMFAGGLVCFLPGELLGVGVHTLLIVEASAISVAVVAAIIVFVEHVKANRPCLHSL